MYQKTGSGLAIIIQIKVTLEFSSNLVSTDISNGVSGAECLWPRHLAAGARTRNLCKS
jgi:hypothetical protein